MEELWKGIKDYENYYQVSNLGNIRNVTTFPRSNRKIWKTGKGYCSVNLSNLNGTRKFTIHRLVAETFIPNPNNYGYINHIDGNKDNNRMDNLEWCTASENNFHRFRILNVVPSSSKLNSLKVLKIRKLLKTHSVSEIAKLYNVTNTTIYYIKDRKTYNKI